MKSGYTHMTILLDRTGSMRIVQKETISGFNEFLEQQQHQPGEATMTLVQFDSENPYEVLYDFVPLISVGMLNGEIYRPRAMTPLMYAVGRGIDELGKKLTSMREEDRPEKILFVILTDGEENASGVLTPKYDAAIIAEMIKHQQERYNWRFIFLGANQDAVLTAKTLNIARGSALTYAHDSQNVSACFLATAGSIGTFRSAAPGVAHNMDFYNDSDRAAQSRISKASA